MNTCFTESTYFIRFGEVVIHQNLGHQLISTIFYYRSRISTLFSSNPAISKRYWPSLILNFPLKCHFLEIFKITVESSLIAYSIGNYILKNIKTELFLIKLKCEEIWRHKKGHDVISSHQLVT